MARFRASIMPVNYRNRQVTRLGYSSMEIRLDGWDRGVKVIAHIDDDGNDTFTIYKTGGSNNVNYCKRITIIENFKEFK